MGDYGWRTFMTSTATFPATPVDIHFYTPLPPERHFPWIIVTACWLLAQRHSLP